MNIISHSTQFADLYGRQTSGDDNNGVWTLLSEFMNALPALGRSCMSYTARINDNQVGLLRLFDFPEPGIFE
jgi:hypothetical protein